MLASLCFEIPGDPVGKQRPRITRKGTYTPDKTRTYERHIRSCGEVARMKNREWEKETPSKKWFILEISIRHSSNRYPDADNVIKSIQDGLEGVIWVNDKTVIPRVNSIMTKSGYPGIHVEIIPLGGDLL